MGNCLQGWHDLGGWELLPATPSDTLPPASLRLLRVPWLPQTVPSLGWGQWHTKYSNTQDISYSDSYQNQRAPKEQKCAYCAKPCPATGARVEELSHLTFTVIVGRLHCFSYFELYAVQVRGKLKVRLPETCDHVSYHGGEGRPDSEWRMPLHH